MQLLPTISNWLSNILQPDFAARPRAEEPALTHSLHLISNMDNKKLEKVDPLTVAESLGIRTYRKISRNTWTPEQDSELTDFLKILTGLPLNQIDADSVDWDIVANNLGQNHRKAKDYKKRWVTSLDPNVRKGRWTKEEDDQLIEAYKRFGASWQKVAAFIKSRTMDQCAKRYTEVLDPKTKDRLNPWTRDEELLLIKQISIHGTKWRTIASNFSNRPALTCRNKWRTIALSVARGRADPHIAAEVEKITKKGMIDELPEAISRASSSRSEIGTNQSYDRPTTDNGTTYPSTNPSSYTNGPLKNSHTEWKYSLTSKDDSHPRTEEIGAIKDEATVRRLLEYAKTYNLQIDVHQHTHHHYAPPPHPFNHVASPPDYNLNFSSGLPINQPRLIFLEPEAQLNRFQHFNYLPPLTEVPKLTSSLPNLTDLKREGSPSSLTPLTQAVELAAGEFRNELRDFRKRDNDFEVSQAKKPRTEDYLRPESASQLAQNPSYNGSTVNQSTDSQAPTQSGESHKDEDEEEDEEMKSYGLFYQSYKKSRSPSHFENPPPAKRETPQVDEEDHEGDQYNFVYENLLGSFGMMPFNPS